MGLGTLFSVFTNPVGFLLSFLTFGVLMIAGGVIAGSTAYMLPAAMSRVRVILALVSVGCLAGGLTYYKGRADCEARYSVSKLQREIEFLQKKISIDDAVRKADEVTRVKLQDKLKSFDDKVKEHAPKVKDVPNCGLDADTTRRLQRTFEIR
jgi:hypothetical protein